MTAQFTPLDQVEWRTVSFLQRPDETWEYQLELPRPLADWDVWAYWERERFHSMREHLTTGEVLFDIGTEQGWCNLVYAQFVGPENMVLVEPTPEFWPNIKATWEHNFTSLPRLTCTTLLSDKNVGDTTINHRSWPDDAYGPLIDRNSYRYIHDNDSGATPEVELDVLVDLSGVVPDAITMDVEGAELLVLQGAANTLATRRPKVWISVHPDLGERDYGVTPDHVHAFMNSFGYTGTHLATDHEEHWYYDPGPR